MSTEKHISNLHEACEAYRDGFKWVGSDSGGKVTAHWYKSDKSLYSTQDSAGENFWELHREICFGVLGSEPFTMQTKLDTVPEDKFDYLTAADWLTVAACIKKTLNMLQKAR